MLSLHTVLLISVCILRWSLWGFLVCLFVYYKEEPSISNFPNICSISFEGLNRISMLVVVCVCFRFVRQILQLWSWALCKRIKRFSLSWVRTAVVICIKFSPFLSLLPFRDDQSPCWLPKCGKAGAASSTRKKTEITIWLRHWEYGEGWHQSWVPMGTRASNACLLPAQLLFSSQNIPGIRTKPSH